MDYWRPRTLDKGQLSWWKPPWFITRRHESVQYLPFGQVWTNRSLAIIINPAHSIEDFSTCWKMSSNEEKMNCLGGQCFTNQKQTLGAQLWISSNLSEHVLCDANGTLGQLSLSHCYCCYVYLTFWAEFQKLTDWFHCQLVIKCLVYVIPRGRPKESEKFKGIFPLQTPLIMTGGIDNAKKGLT